jgi:type 1 fimbriae regulatory protein FimB/type 1 fimbriae regulatory protein FimE
MYGRRPSESRQLSINAVVGLGRRHHGFGLCATVAATRWPTPATTPGRCHKNIQHTVRYTELAPDRFKNFWRD